MHTAGVRARSADCESSAISAPPAIPFSPNEFHPILPADLGLSATTPRRWPAPSGYNGEDIALQGGRGGGRVAKQSSILIIRVSACSSGHVAGANTPPRMSLLFREAPGALARLLLAFRGGSRLPPPSAAGTDRPSAEPGEGCARIEGPRGRLLLSRATVSRRMFAPRASRPSPNRVRYLGNGTPSLPQGRRFRGGFLVSDRSGRETKGFCVRTRQARSITCTE